uniref:Uncharacterized protein n=1 Tax=Anguilla anguilla TaxID=7936 RepID=A0A0E9WEC0_ANGAN
MAAVSQDLHGSANRQSACHGVPWPYLCVVTCLRH